MITRFSLTTVGVCDNEEEDWLEREKYELVQMLDMYDNDCGRRESHTIRVLCETQDVRSADVDMLVLMGDDAAKMLRDFLSGFPYPIADFVIEYRVRG